MTIVNVVPLVFSIPGDLWQELGNRSRKGMGENLLEFKVRDSDFPPLFGVLEGWLCAVGHSLWSYWLMSNPQAGKQPLLLELALVL